MYPYLYQSGNTIIGTYGVMLAIAYLTGRYLYLKQLEKVVKPPVNLEILIISLLVFGIIGAKLMFILKNPDRASLTDWNSLFAGSGFSSQGAILAAIIVTVTYCKINKIALYKLLDSAAIPAIIAYALARLGCFLAGDDCYGQATELPIGMRFPNGIEPTHVPVHPLPLYEIVYSLAIWQTLRWVKTKNPQPYMLFFTLLLTWGACRFLVEFISINPIKAFGMSGSQIGALLMFLFAFGYFALNRTKMIGQKKAG